MRERKRDETCGLEPFAQTVERTAGDTLMSVEVGAGTLFDAGCFVESNAGRDVLTLSDGTWGVGACPNAG